MEQTSILSVRIKKADDVSFAEIMIRLRTWLDAAKIQPKKFRSLADGFELSFLSENDVQRFTAEFGDFERS